MLRRLSLFIAAIEVVSGMPFGQACTQFCELPQPSMPPSSISASRRSSLFISPVGWALNRRTCEIAAGPMKLLLSLTFGQASRQTPQVMHLDSSYAHCRFDSGHARTRTEVVRAVDRNPRFDAFQRIEHALRSTIRSRTTGNVLIGSSRIGCSSLSISAVHAWRGLPLITIEQAPHTSSRQFDSQHDRRRFFALGVDRIALNFHQRADHVHVRTVRNFELFRIRSCCPGCPAG